MRSGTSFFPQVCQSFPVLGHLPRQTQSLTGPANLSPGVLDLRNTNLNSRGKRIPFPKGGKILLPGGRQTRPRIQRSQVETPHLWQKVLELLWCHWGLQSLDWLIQLLRRLKKVRVWYRSGTMYLYLIIYKRGNYLRKSNL